MQLVIDTHSLSKTFRRVDALKSLNLSVPKYSMMTGAHVYTFGALYSSLVMAAVFVFVALWVFERQEL